MATLVNVGSGNWNTAATWGVAEAGSSAIQATVSASTNTTASYVNSSAFTCTNADVLIGVVMSCKRVNTTGTVTIGFSADNGSTYAKEVTVNASDLPADQTWVMFKFDSALTADGGSDYKVAIKGSSAGNATFYRDATAGNWARVPVTNTAPGGAPSAGDNLYVVGNWTAAATGSSYTVTMDAVAASIVDHGALTIGQNGTVDFGNAASTNYYLRLSGDLTVWSGGTFSMGKVGAAIPSTSTAKLNFDCGSNVQYGLIVKDGGTFNAQGASKTTWTYLAADAAANATSLTTADSTGWADNDEIAIAPTTRTYSQYEKGAMNGAASGTTLTVDGFGGTGGGVAYAHSGTAPTRAEIINLTRNVQIFGASASYQSYIYVSTSATCDWDNVEMYWLGSATANKYGVTIYTAAGGSFSAVGCSLHDFAVNGSVGLNFASANNNFTVDACVLYNIYNCGIHVENTAGVDWSVTDNVVIGIVSSQYGIWLEDLGGTVTGNIVSGTSSAGIACELAGTSATTGTFATNTVHSSNTYGFRFLTALTTPSGPVTFSDLTAWRNNDVGVYFAIAPKYPLTLDGVIAFGNKNGNITLLGPAKFRLLDVTSSGDSTFSTASGLTLNPTSLLILEIESSTFGVASGIKTAHTADLVFASGTFFSEITCRNVNFASASPQDELDDQAAGSFIRCQKYGQSATDHRTFQAMGSDTAVIQTDTAIYKTAAPSERITPASASVKIESGPHRKSVASGATATFSVWVRKSVSTDSGGADYNGAEPRLVLKAAPALGITTDTVLDTMTAAVGNWEQLTGTSAAANDDGVLEAVVDLDGTAGWVNVDDFS